MKIPLMILSVLVSATITAGPSRQGHPLPPVADRTYRAIQPGDGDRLQPYPIGYLAIERNASHNIRNTFRENRRLGDGGDPGADPQAGA